MNIKKEFFDFIQQSKYPCLGAKIALSKKLITVCIGSDIRDPQDDVFILSAIYKFIEQWNKNKDLVYTFALIFKNTALFSEDEFELLLWERLQALHIMDSKKYEWNSSVSSEVNDPSFSFCLGGVGFFIIGLHPNSSRKSRQFTHPAFIFNPHDQFQLMRKIGAFETMKNKIRQRDKIYSGSINPMLDDFGVHSEALQYSGKITSKSYKCPFVIKN